MNPICILSLSVGHDRQQSSQWDALIAKALPVKHPPAEISTAQHLQLNVAGIVPCKLATRILHLTIVVYLIGMRIIGNHVSQQPARTKGCRVHGVPRNGTSVYQSYQVAQINFSCSPRSSASTRSNEVLEKAFGCAWR